jgi:aromatic ring hydroxylase
MKVKVKLVTFMFSSSNINEKLNFVKLKFPSFYETAKSLNTFNQMVSNIFDYMYGENTFLNIQKTTEYNELCNLVVRHGMLTAEGDNEILITFANEYSKHFNKYVEEIEKINDRKIIFTLIELGDLIK